MRATALIGLILGGCTSMNPDYLQGVAAGGGDQDELGGDAGAAGGQVDQVATAAPDLGHPDLCGDGGELGQVDQLAAPADDLGQVADLERPADLAQRRDLFGSCGLLGGLGCSDGFGGRTHCAAGLGALITSCSAVAIAHCSDVRGCGGSGELSCDAAGNAVPTPPRGWNEGYCLPGLVWSNGKTCEPCPDM